MVTVQNVGWWLYLIMQAEEKKWNNHICCRKDFNQLYYQDVPDMCLPNVPRTASCWPVTTLIFFIFVCSHVITLLPKGERKPLSLTIPFFFLHLFPWFQPANTCAETAYPPPLPPSKMDFCQCVFVLQLIMCHHVYLSLCVSPRNTISGKWLAFCQRCAHSHPHISVFVRTFIDKKHYPGTLS